MTQIQAFPKSRCKGILIFTVLLFCLRGFLAFGQHAPPSQLSEIWESSAPTEEKINKTLPILDSLTGKAETSDTVKKYIQKVLLICEEEGAEKILQKGQALSILGDFYAKEKDQFESAKKAYTEALQIFQSKGNDVWSGIISHSLGNLYDSQDHYFAANQAYEQSIQLTKESLKETENPYFRDALGRLYLDRGMALRKLGILDSAIVSLERAIEYKQASTPLDYKGLVLAHYHLAMIVRDQSRLGANQTTGQDKALALLQQAYHWYNQWKEEEHNSADPLDPKILADCLLIEASIWEAKEEYEKAIQLNRQAMRLYDEFGNSTDVVRAKINLGSNYYQLKEFENADIVYQDALDLLPPDSEKWLLAHIYENLFHLKKYQGANQEAVEYSEKSEIALENAIADSEWNLALLGSRQFESQTLIKNHLDERLNLLEEITLIKASLLGSLLLVVLIIWGFVYYQINQKRIHKQQILDVVKDQDKELTNAFLQGQDQERAQFAAELHDNLANNLAACKTLLEILPIVEEGPEENTSGLQNRIISLLDDTYQSTRHLSHQVKHSIASSSFGAFHAEIQDLLENLRLHGYAVQVKAEGSPEDQIRYTVAFQVKRTLQEAIANIVDYARASNVSVHLNSRADSLFVSIEDNGRGFNTDLKSEGIGIQNMKMRTYQMGGEIKITSSPGNGTCISIQIPKHYHHSVFV